jgi:putative mycofactocin binding protein MftB
VAEFADGCGWMLHPSVGLRPEPFGALAYHYGTRRLTFLKDRTLTEVVRSLSDHPDVRSTLVALGVPAERHPTYIAALDRLADADVIRIRTPQPEVTGVR